MKSRINPFEFFEKWGIFRKSLIFWKTFCKQLLFSINYHLRYLDNLFFGKKHFPLL